MDTTLHYAEGRPPESDDRPANAPASATNLSLKVAPLSRILPAAGAFSLADLPEYITRRITVHPVAACWIVGGKPTRNGHARIGGRSAARVVWEYLVDPDLDPKLDLDHREDWGCVSKQCVYPAHLKPCSHFENMTRTGARGVAALNIRKTRCSVCGTPYDLLNCYVYKNRRDCRRCIARRQRGYQARQRARAAVVQLPLEDLGRAA